MTSRSTLRLTVEDRASAQNAPMISASRCSMVIRRAYWLISARVLIWSSLVMMTVGRVSAQSGDDSLADGAGVAGQRDGGSSWTRGRSGSGRSRATVLKSLLARLLM